MSMPDPPPAVSIVGKKNSGKTTLLVALAAELKRRRFRVASIKHGHHAAEIDQPGRDSWRHFHEGEVEAVLLLSGDRLALVQRLPAAAPDPATLIQRHLTGHGYDLVLVEGFKHGPLPKVEVFRRGVHQHPVFDPTDEEAAAMFLAIVTDDPSLQAPCPVIPLDPTGPAGTHVHAVADLLAWHLSGDQRDG